MNAGTETPIDLVVEVMGAAAAVNESRILTASPGLQYILLQISQKLETVAEELADREMQIVATHN
ncbi:hypothetical protein [Halodesulfovibrio aestuarii]|uniref:Uncharacterized protein n=1 Tax=Halodesulfovibrio aestuarii TaxID=126333 RepID=A0ABV4JTV9_9BACT